MSGLRPSLAWPLFLLDPSFQSLLARFCPGVLMKAGYPLQFSHSSSLCTVRHPPPPLPPHPPTPRPFRLVIFLQLFLDTGQAWG